MRQEYKGDIGLYLSGQQVKVPSCGIFITQPTIRDIVIKSNETEFMTGAYLLSHTEEFAATIKAGNSELENVPDFQIIIGALRQGQAQFINIINKFFDLCLPQFTMKCSMHSLDFTTEDGVQVGMLTPFNYGEFACTVKELFLPTQSEQNPKYKINEADEASRRLLEKIQKNREALAKAKAVKEGSSVSLFGLYVSVLSVGMGLDINTLYGYTPFQLYDTFNRFIAKTARDQYEATLRVPFADTSKLKSAEPPSWFENLYKPKEEEYNSLQALNDIGSSAK